MSCSGFFPPSAGDIAEALAEREEDQADPNLPLMLWYAIEPLIHTDPSRFADLVAKARMPLLRRHIARRVTSFSEEPEAIDQLVRTLVQAANTTQQEDTLQGMLLGFKGIRNSKNACCMANRLQAF